MLKQASFLDLRIVTYFVVRPLFFVVSELLSLIGLSESH